MKPILTFLCSLLLVCPGFAKDKQPNVLFIAVDDLNDWVGCLGGHPQAKTPNIDRLASRGVLFENAHCAAPLCNPSRTAVMTGLRPSTTGIYGNLAWFRDIPKYKNWATLPQYFRQHGYFAWGGGKIYHKPNEKFSDPASWDEQYSTRHGTALPSRGRTLRYAHGMKEKIKNPIQARLMDWGPIDEPIEASADWKTADGAADYLQKKHDKPFFLACGIYRPHLEWYAPPGIFRPPPPRTGPAPRHPRERPGRCSPHWQAHGQRRLRDRQRTPAVETRRPGIPRRHHLRRCLCRSPPRRPGGERLRREHHRRPLGRPRLPDRAKGKVCQIRPLAAGHSHPAHHPRPGNAANGTRCSRPASLIDLYPTLLDLCNLPARDDLDGRSIAPLVRNPEAKWPHPAIITHSPHWLGVNHAVRSERWHYIRYADGGEELYDMTKDPNQWHNLAMDPVHTAAKMEVKKWLPKKNAPHFGAPKKK